MDEEEEEEGVEHLLSEWVSLFLQVLLCPGKQRGRRRRRKRRRRRRRRRRRNIHGGVE